MTELPKGWALCALGDVTVNRDRERMAVNAKDRSARLGDVPYFGAAGQVGWIDRPLFDERLLLLGEDGVQFFDADKSKAYMISGPSWVNNHAHVLSGVEGVSLAYLMHYLNQFDYQGYANGSTRLKLTRSSMDVIPVRLAPTAEQERIVAAIEEVFSKLDAGEAGLRTVRQLLERMRDAILTAAVTGRLVPQDPADTPAAKLLAELGIEEVSPSDGPQLPAGWCWLELGEAAYDSGYGTSAKCSYDADGPGVLRIPNIRGGRVDLTDLKRAPASARLDDSLFLSPGDLLIVRTNGSHDLIGRCAAVTTFLGCSFASYLIRFRLRTDLLDGSFASLQLTAQWWRRRLQSLAASSAGQYNLSLRGLAPTPMALPPLEEQARIVTEVERQFSFIDACERAVDAGLVRSAGLRRSVLKAAFDEGRLAPQDPSDEPASVLLDRIRAESAAKPIAQRRARQTA